MSETSRRTDIDIAHDLAIRNFRLMENWDDTDASAILAPNYQNVEAVAEPPAAGQPGVAGARATYDWLHSAYAELHWTIHTVVAEGEWVVVRGNDVRPPDRPLHDLQTGRGGRPGLPGHRTHLRGIPDALVPRRRRTTRGTQRRS